MVTENTNIEISLEEVLFNHRIAIIERMNAKESPIFDELHLNQAIAELECENNIRRLIFPKGREDFFAFAHVFEDDLFFEDVTILLEDAKGIGQAIAILTKARLKKALENRHLLQAATAFFANPLYARKGVDLLWSTVDKIWLAVDPDTVGFSYYSKRSLLLGVYSSALLFALSSEVSESELDDYLARRFADIRNFGEFKRKYFE